MFNLNQKYKQTISLNYKQEDISDLHQALLNQNTSLSFLGKIFKIVKSHKLTSEQIFEKEQYALEKALKLKRLELINDPIFVQAQIKKKQSFINKISELTNVFKVIEPETTWLIYWNFLISFIILYYFFEIGIVVFLGQQAWEAELSSKITYLFNVIAIFILFLDMLIQFNTGYYSQGILIINRLKVVTNYLKKYFIIDFSSAFMIATCFFTQNMTLNYVKMIFYLKITSLYRIDAIFTRIIVFYLKWNVVYIILKQIIMVLMITHYLGIIFFAIDYYVYNNNLYGPSTPSRCWVFTAQAYSQLIFEPWYIWYLYSFYFSLGTMTTIAYGDITPQNPLDTIYVIFVLIICCIQFSYVLFNVIQALFLGIEAKSKVKQMKIQCRQQILLFDKYMKSKNIPSLLKIKTKAFIQNCWKQQMYRDRQTEQQMIKKLPKELREELLLGICSKFMQQLLIFNYPNNFINCCIEKISEVRYSREEIICKVNKLSSNLLYLTNGRVDVYLTQKLHVKILSETSVGIVEFYTQTTNSFSIKALEDTNAYVICIQQLQELIRCNRQALQIKKSITDRCRDEDQQNKIFNFKCYFCQQNHLFLRCPHSQYRFPLHQTIQVTFKLKQKRISCRRTIKKTQFSSCYFKHQCETTAWYSKIKRNSTRSLKQISQQKICQNADFETIQQFLEETLQIMSQIQQALTREQQECIFQEMKSYQIYFPSYNILNLKNLELAIINSELKVLEIRIMN